MVAVVGLIAPPEMAVPAKTEFVLSTILYVVAAAKPNVGAALFSEYVKTIVDTPAVVATPDAMVSEASA